MKSYVFYCTNNLDSGELSVLGRGNEDLIKTVSLPCAGKVDVPYLMKAFESGADGVAIVTCQKNACRHFEGNLRAQKRAQTVEMLLEEIGLERGRIAVLACDKQNTGAVLADINRFLEQVRTLSGTHPGSSEASQSQATSA